MILELKNKGGHSILTVIEFEEEFWLGRRWRMMMVTYATAMTTIRRWKLSFTGEIFLFERPAAEALVALWDRETN